MADINNAFDPEHINTGITKLKDAQELISTSVKDIRDIAEGAVSKAEMLAKEEKWDKFYGPKFEEIEKMLGEFEQMKAKMQSASFIHADQGKAESMQSKQDFQDFLQATGNYSTGRKQSLAISVDSENIEQVLTPEGVSYKAKPMATDQGTQGGYAAEMIEMSNQVRERGIEITPFEANATVLTINGTRWEEVYEGDDAPDPTDVAERQIRQQTGTPTLLTQAIELYANHYYPVITRKMLQTKTIVDIYSYLMRKLTTQRSKKVQKSYLTGDGTAGPVGILSGKGRSSEITVLKSGQATALYPEFTDFFDMMAEIIDTYTDLKWYANQDTIMKHLWKYTDGNGRPFIDIRNPYVMQGAPIVKFSGMPNVGAGSKPLMFGDLKATYLVLKNLWMSITRDEITAPGFIKFNTEMYSGGDTVQPEGMTILEVGV